VETLFVKSDENQNPAKPKTFAISLSCAPVPQGLLVRLEHRAGEKQPGGQQEEDDARDPDALTRRLERRRGEGTDHVQNQRDDERRRQPVVQAANQGAGEGLVGDVDDAGGRACRGRVVELREVGAGDDEQDEARHGDPAQGVGERAKAPGRSCLRLP